MGELLGSLFAGLLKGFFAGLLQGIFEDLFDSAGSRLTRLTLGGKQGSIFMIRYAEATGGTNGLIRESKRRKCVNIILAALLFVMFFEFFFWIVALIATNVADLEWERHYGFYLLASTSAVFLSVVLISRRAVASRQLRVPVPEGCFSGREFAVPGSMNATGKSLLFTFGFLFGVLFILSAVFCVTVGSSPWLLIIIALTFLASVGMILLALREHPKIIPIMKITPEGIFKGSDSTIKKDILWNSIQDLSIRKHCLYITPAAKDNKPDKPIIIGLGHSLLSPEIIAYKLSQYRSAAM